MLASRDGHVAVVKALLDAGARHEPTSTIGYDALNYAEQQGQMQVKRILESAIKLRKKQAQETISQTVFSVGGGGGGGGSSAGSSVVGKSPLPPSPSSLSSLTSISLPASVSLAGKVAIITGCGSSSGIGFAIAAHLMSLGSAVVVTSTSDRISEREKELQQMFPAGRVTSSFGDLTSEAYCLSLINFAVSSFQNIDILVNNAGMTSVSDPERKEPDESGDVLNLAFSGWKNSLSRNLDTMFLVTKFALPHIKLRTGGRIINIASTTGPVNATTGDVGYATAKAGMTGFTRAVALDCANFGITCNAIAPGWICTGSQSEFEAAQGRKTPMHRSGLPSEIASCVGFLASPGASYMTGQVLVIDGGNSIDEARDSN